MSRWPSAKARDVLRALERIGVSPNKQLQRTVIPRRERAISLCARAALHTAARGR